MFNSSTLLKFLKPAFLAGALLILPAASQAVCPGSPGTPGSTKVLMYYSVGDAYNGSWGAKLKAILAAKPGYCIDVVDVGSTLYNPTENWSNYDQVWDYRFVNLNGQACGNVTWDSFDANWRAKATSYLQNCGNLFLQGENAGFNSRSGGDSIFLTAIGAVSGAYNGCAPDNSSFASPTYTIASTLPGAPFLSGYDPGGIATAQVLGTSWVTANSGWNHNASLQRTISAGWSGAAQMPSLGGSAATTGKLAMVWDQSMFEWTYYESNGAMKANTDVYFSKLSDWMGISSCGTPTYTPATTPTFTVTRSNTRTSTPTSTPTRTSTPAATPSQTPSVTPTSTSTVTFTSTFTATPTRTVTETSTSTISFTPTATASPTRTVTATSTSTISFTSTSTASPTRTVTATSTSTVTFTATYTRSPTPSITDTNTPGPTPTFTATPSATRTVTPTATQTVTATASPTHSPTATQTVTRTATPSATPTSTITDTNTPGPTATYTATRTATRTNTPSATETATSTATPTFTSTATATPSRTVTGTCTQTAVFTATNTPSSTATPSVTATRTATVTVTASRSITASSTPTASNTATATRSASPTESATRTASPTITQTPTWSNTPVPMPNQLLVTLYNSAGERVKTLFNGSVQYISTSMDLSAPLVLSGAAPVSLNLAGAAWQGVGGMAWDGDNDSGQFVSSGAYYFKIEFTDPVGGVTALIRPVQVLNGLGQHRLEVYNSAGELVATQALSGTALATGSMTLDSEAMVAGQRLDVTLKQGANEVPWAWDGRNNQGVLVDSGSYTLQLVQTWPDGRREVQSKGFVVLKAPLTVLPCGEFKAVPNPVRAGQPVTVLYDPAPGLWLRARLYNAAGELVGSLSQDAGQGSAPLGDSRLASGVYVAEFEVREGVALIRRDLKKIAVVR
jgi:hypothetical protein